MFDAAVAFVGIVGEGRQMSSGSVGFARSVLVGRDSELDRVLSVLDGVFAGEGRVMLIAGEPGIGKTRLVEELAALAGEQGALVVWGRVDDADGAPPYWPWVQVLEQLLQSADEAVLREALVAGAPIAAVVPAVARFAPALTAPGVLDAAAARFGLHVAIFDFFAAIATRRPLVLVIDDLHWADASSLELTRFVATRLPAARLLLALTYRSVDGGQSQPFDDVLAVLARERGLERVELVGLSEAEVGRFMTQTIGLRPRPASISSVHARTEGNPFFVGEVARLLHSEGRFGANGPTDGDPVPAGVVDVLRRRLMRLPAAANELLVLGAVIGREFDIATLTGVANVAALNVIDAIEPALAAGLVHQSHASMSRLRFSHVLVRDTIYLDLSELRRATLHARVAVVLEAQREETASQLSELALHFFYAAPVLGPGRGLDYALQAAEAAQAALAYEQAEDSLGRALTLVEQVPAGRDRLQREILVQNRLATLLTATRGLSAPETADAWTRSRQLHTQLGDARELLAPLFGLFIVHCTRGDHATATTIGDQLLEVGEAVQDAALLLAGHDVAGMAALERGRLAEAAEHLERSMTLIDQFDAPSLMSIFPMHPCGFIVELAVAYHLMGYTQRAEKVRAQAAAVRDSLDEPLSVGPGLILDLQLRVCQGAVNTMADDAAAAAKLCRTWGLIEMAAAADFWELYALQQRDGRNRTAALGEALTALDDSGFRIWRTQHLAIFAECCRQVGDNDRALELIDEGLRDADRNDERFWEPELLRARGELLSHGDPRRYDEAVGCVEQALALARSQGSAALQQRAEITLAALSPPPSPPVTAAGDARPLLILSARERQLLTLVGQGLTDKQIAADLVISIATVRSHLDRIRDKTGRRRRADLTRLAVELGLS